MGGGSGCSRQLSISVRQVNHYGLFVGESVPWLCVVSGVGGRPERRSSSIRYCRDATITSTTARVTLLSGSTVILGKLRRVVRCGRLKDVA